MNRSAFFWLPLAVAVFSFAGCGGDTEEPDACTTAGERRVCLCEGGIPSVQECLPTGYFDACACTGEADVENDTDVEVPDADAPDVEADTVLLDDADVEDGEDTNDVEDVDDTDVTPLDPECVLVTPEGTSFELPGVSIIIPPRAVSEDVVICVRLRAELDPSPLVAVTPIFEFSPVDTTFVVPIIVGFDESVVGPFPNLFWGELGNSERFLPLDRETCRVGENGHVQCECQHLSVGFGGSAPD
ncbi:MAG: hypothetical protein ACJA1R_001597, partial [Flavobacteriales bacterium]